VRNPPEADWRLFWIRPDLSLRLMSEKSAFKPGMTSVFNKRGKKRYRSKSACHPEKSLAE
jgi:hypothetical protein